MAENVESRLFAASKAIQAWAASGQQLAAGQVKALMKGLTEAAIKELPEDKRQEIVEELTGLVAMWQLETQKILQSLQLLLSDLQAVPADDTSPLAEVGSVLTVVEVNGRRRLQIVPSEPPAYRRITRGVGMLINGRFSSLVWLPVGGGPMVQLKSEHPTPFADIPLGSRIEILARETKGAIMYRVTFAFKPIANEESEIKISGLAALDNFLNVAGDSQGVLNGRADLEREKLLDIRSALVRGTGAFVLVGQRRYKLTKLGSNGTFEAVKEP